MLKWLVRHFQNGIGKFDTSSRIQNRIISPVLPVEKLANSRIMQTLIDAAVTTGSWAGAATFLFVAPHIIKKMRVILLSPWQGAKIILGLLPKINEQYISPRSFSWLGRIWKKTIWIIFFDIGGQNILKSLI
jgi:hypothetical protein